jgi:pyrimidine-nucleoside phosphorylase
MAEESIASGAALAKFRALVQAQGGDVSYVDEPEKLPQARFIEALAAERGGYLARVDARIIGEASVVLGAGRAKKGDPIDHAVGFIVHHKVGDRIERGQPLVTNHAGDAAKGAEARASVAAAFEWGDGPEEPLPLFYE